MADPKILPNITSRELVDAAWDRLTEWYIFDTRTNRIGNKEMISWKDRRIRDNDAMYRGDWTAVLPDETGFVDLPMIQNMVQTAADDLARLIADNQPRVFSPPLSTKDTDIHAARVREMALKTYWKKGRGEQLRPWLTMDLALTGTAFLSCVHPSNKKDYPKPFRLDPRGAFPDVLNGELQDLIMLQRIRARQAEFMLGIDLTTAFGTSVGPGSYEDIEIIDYYHPMGMVRVLTAVSNNEPIGVPFLQNRVRYDLDHCPVAFAQLPTGDGNFRGLYDQLKGILLTENRIATLMRDYMDQSVYAPWFEFNVQNAQEKPGPKTIYHGLDERSRMERVQPAISSPQVYQTLDFFDRAARAGASRPAAREGETDVSQGTGSFMDSSQGNLTTMVRDIARQLGFLQEDWNTTALQMDERFGNVEKPLWRPVGKQSMYRPKTDINGTYDNEVTYGTGAGLDYLNRKAAIFQEVGAQLISKDSARSQMDDISDPEAERVKIDRELVQEAYLQRLTNSDDPTDLEAIIKEMASGSDFFTAASKVSDAKQAAMQAQQEQQQQAAAQGGGESPTPGLATGQQPAAPAGPAGAPAAPQMPAFLPSQQLPTQVQVGR